jgi:hypothetical protein
MTHSPLLVDDINGRNTFCAYALDQCMLVIVNNREADRMFPQICLYIRRILVN